MRRRTYLREVGSVTALIGLAGCVTNLGESLSLSDTEHSDEIGESQETIAQTSFSVLNRSCGSGNAEASIQLHDETVIVSGTIVGNDGCSMAELVDVTFQDNVLTVVIGIFREDQGESVGCADCVTDLDYRFESRPESHVAEVRVIHQSSQGEKSVVATEEYEPGKVVTG